MFFRQVWTLVKKDLIILVRRHGLSTAIRALLFPIVFTVILAHIKFWITTPGEYGIGSPGPVKSLSDALAFTGKTRPKFAIVNGGFTDGDIGDVIKNLSDIVTAAGKELHVLTDTTDLPSICPSSNGGVSNCFGAIEFHSSPDHGGKNWNYTMYTDSSIGGSISVAIDTNDQQIYQLPLQRAVDSAIASTHGGSGLPPIQQYPYTFDTEAKKEDRDAKRWQDLIKTAIAFAFFIALAGIVYHMTGHVVQQRERGMFQLIDAMMPNMRRWECLVARTLATHIAFDIVYLPGWIAAGGGMSTAFPNSNPGYFVLLCILAGLALSSYSLLASSLFRRAQLSAISAIIAALVFALAAQFGLGPFIDTAFPGVVATAILFPPSTFIFFLVAAACYEFNDLPLALGQDVPIVPGYYWGITAGAFLGLLAVQIVLFPIFGILIEKALHGRSSRSRKLLTREEMADTAVRLTGFSKHYKNLKDKKKTVKAVDDLTLSLHAGSITVLLGANGSGKSTTLNAIAGLETITKGTIELDGTGGLGLCPQKNIMWDELTVRENVDIFEALKRTTPQSRAEREREVARLIEACGLEIKTSAKVKTLSGGQKRRAQLALMLAGGSRVCCIDEASSGLDPVARRKVWDIMLSERGHRSIFFTTHFLDEAEVLSDHIAILSKGKLKAEGTVASLKNELGGGYRVLLEAEPPLQVPELQNSPNVTRHADYGKPVYEVPDQASLAPLVSALERHKIFKYRIQGPTIENVFLATVDELRESEEARELLPAGHEHLQNADSDGETQAERPRDRSLATSDQTIVLETGKGCSPMQQVGVLFLKRLIILKHNYMPYVGALFVSLVVAGLVTRFYVRTQYPNGVPCLDPNDSNTGFTYPARLYPTELQYGSFTFGPGSVNDTLIRVVPNDTSPYASSSSSHSSRYNWGKIHVVNSLAEFNDFIAKNSSRLYFGGFYDDPTTPTFAWYSTSYSSPDPLLVQSALHSVILNQTIEFGFRTFKAAWTPSSGTGSFVALLTALGFAIYPGLFALYPTAERLRNVRAMEFSNGILSSSLWIAYSLFDLMFIVLISVLTVAIWYSQYRGWYGLGYMFVVFFLYGLAATAFSYVISLFVKSQVAAIAFTAVIQVIIVVLYFVAYVLSAVNAPTTDVYTWFNYIHYTIALISPAANLMRALFMAVNNYSLICRGSEQASYPGEIGIYGAPILYLIVQFLLLVAFLMFWESGRSLEVFGIKRKQRAPDHEKSAGGSVDPDAAEDPWRLSGENDGLRLLEVSKSFGSNKAVEDVSFGILPSEKFALLGPNGAGKSTVISLIRGDLAGQQGTIYIGNDSLSDAPVAARNHLGVCPQFDAQDSMTVIEHLRFYARARGVPNREANIEELIKRLGLDEHRNKLAKKLSGGTQRKLSLAIALVANPGVLLLDEPSSGMDAAAKRALWSTLSAISAGRVLLLTTHSMEEADYLCDRAGIMAGRLLALGSVEELRARHGNKAYIHLVHKNAPKTTDEEMGRLRAWVEESFGEDTKIEQKVFGGQLRFSIPQQQQYTEERRVDGGGGGGGGGSGGKSSMGYLFNLIEGNKEKLGIVHYSIGPGTLEQVFLNVVAKNDVKEENSNVRQPYFSTGGGKKRWWKRK